jgi:hypothetical protein
MRVEILMNKLTFDRRGPTCMYGLTGSPLGERGTSWQESPEDPNTPSILVRQIEGCPKGCEELIANWRGLAQRLENNLPWQAYDRLLATRMLGRQPTDCGRDERVNVIFVASFALHPKGRVEAYEELKSDMGALELEAFKDRIRKRWPLLIDAQDTATAKSALVDLVQGCIQRLEAKLEVYRQLAEERPTRTATPLTPEEKRELERLRQFELACERRVHRCENAFWKHRRETERTENGGSGPEEAIRHDETAESKPDSGAGEEVMGAPNKNSTNEPSFGGDVPKVGTMEEVAALARELGVASAEFRRVRSAGFGAVAAQGAGGGVVPGAIAEAIFGRGPLLRPIT